MCFFKGSEYQQSELALTGQQHGVLLERLPDLIGLSGQRALVDLQVVALDQDPISRQQVSCRHGGQKVHYVYFLKQLQIFSLAVISYSHEAEHQNITLNIKLLSTTF